MPRAMAGEVEGAPKSGVLEQLAEVCLVNLFGDYNVQIRTTADTCQARSASMLFGVIGFTAEGLGGSVVLAVNELVLEGCNPLENGPARDWIGELVNQFVGRIKNKLLAYDTPIYITTPVVFRGDRVVLETKEESSELAYVNTQGHNIAVWIDVDVDPGFELLEKEGGADSSVPEGETLMF